MRDQHTAEVANLAAINDRKHYVFDENLLATESIGDFWSLLDQLGISLAVSREYEHFIVLIGGPGGVPWQSPLPLPHPSGLCFDQSSQELVVSSTRTPNLIFWMRHLGPADYEREIIPPDFHRPQGELFLPYRSTLLPGTLYIHDIALIGGDLYATVTGHNFLARLDATGGWSRVWWPAILDDLGGNAFDQNYLQLNSIAVGPTLEKSCFTAFSDQPEGPKPWKQGYGPKGKGVVFAAATRDVVCRGLTCPHSARFGAEGLWLCNSGYGEVGVISRHAHDQTVSERFEPIAHLPGFTRGLALWDDYAFVGLSRVIENYEPYAPGIKASDSQCAIYAIERSNGRIAGGLIWPHGFQIYDIQIIPGMRRPQLPFGQHAANGVNHLLRFLG